VLILLFTDRAIKMGQLFQRRKEGLEQGIRAVIKFCREDSYTRDKTCSGLMERFSIALEEAEEYLEKYWLA
jgi:hypothetical protein